MAITGRNGLLLRPRVIIGLLMDDQIQIIKDRYLKDLINPSPKMTSGVWSLAMSGGDSVK